MTNRGTRHSKYPQKQKGTYEPYVEAICRSIKTGQRVQSTKLRQCVLHALPKLVGIPGAKAGEATHLHSMHDCSLNTYQ